MNSKPSWPDPRPRGHRLAGELEATQFSTTTKLKGKANFVMGATNALGDNPKGMRDYNADWGAFTFSYDLRLGLKTSFTGKDLLFTRLRVGNHGSSTWDGEGVILNKLDTETGGNVEIDRLYYRFLWATDSRLRAL